MWSITVPWETHSAILVMGREKSTSIQRSIVPFPLYTIWLAESLTVEINILTWVPNKPWCYT